MPTDSWTVDVTADALLLIIREAVDDYENSERSGEPSCIECTAGATPNHLNKGPCWYHRARPILAGRPAASNHVDDLKVALRALLTDAGAVANALHNSSDAEWYRAQIDRITDTGSAARRLLDGGAS